MMSNHFDDQFEVRVDRNLELRFVLLVELVEFYDLFVVLNRRKSIEIFIKIHFQFFEISYFIDIHL
jgi:hypothetical protein